jgi:uncharacterized protein (TIGR00255 family)
MTGYGEATVPFPGGRVVVEAKAVNHRFAEIRFTLPREYYPWEAELRGIVQEMVKRGKLEVTIYLSGQQPKGYEVRLNMELARAYLGAFSHIHKELGVQGEADLSFFVARPELFQVMEKPRQKPWQPDTEVQAAKQALRRALTALDRERCREGRFLKRDVVQRVQHLERLWKKVKKRLPVVQEELKEKFHARVTALLAGAVIDQGRLLQEVAFLVQRSDVTEEIVRLHSHLTALRALLQESGPIGKKMDFLLQEMQREVNTVGSKADDAAVRQLVVEAKGEVEKLREQAQNIE